MAEGLTGADVEGIVDRKIEAFREEMKLEFAPIRLQLASHEAQMTEVRTSANRTQAGISRIEGKMEAYSEQQATNHAENLKKAEREGEKLEDLAEKLNLLIGQRDGEAGLLDRQEDAKDRRHTRIREWAKVATSILSFSGIVELARRAIHHFHHTK